jgi:hypothetical protein
MASIAGITSQDMMLFVASFGKGFSHLKCHRTLSTSISQSSEIVNKISSLFSTSPPPPDLSTLQESETKTPLVTDLLPSWPEKDGSSLPIISIKDYGTRQIYPRNRLISFTYLSLRKHEHISQFKASLNSHFPGAMNTDALVQSDINRKKFLRLRLTGDMAPEIVRSQMDGKILQIAKKKIVFYPMIFTPRRQRILWPLDKKCDRVVVMNLCWGWSSDEFSSCVRQAFESLDLQGTYQLKVEPGGFNWLRYHFITFSSEEDVEKVIGRYGYETVERNPGTGLVFEGCELWIAKATSLKPRGGAEVKKGDENTNAKSVVLETVKGGKAADAV